MQRDVVAVIDAHHRLLQGLVDRLLLSQSSPAYRRLFDEFAKGLGGLQRAIDHAVLPVLRTHGWQQLSSQFLREHMELEQQLGDLLTLCPDTPAFESGLRAIAVKLGRHRALAEAQVFPWLKTMLGDGQRDLLGQEVQGYINDILGESSKDFDESEPAVGLLEDAKLVLGSLPAR